MKALVFFNNTPYAINIDTNFSYAEYALQLRDTSKSLDKINHLLSNAIITTNLNFKEYDCVLKFENDIWWFWEFDLGADGIWDNTEDYVPMMSDEDKEESLRQLWQELMDEKNANTNR